VQTPRSTTPPETEEAERVDRFLCYLGTIPQDERPRAMGERLAALAEMIGPRPALALAARAGGTRLDVPSLARLARMERDQAIRTARKAGATQRTLSQHFRLTPRRIRSILKEGTP